MKPSQSLTPMVGTPIREHAAINPGRRRRRSATGVQTSCASAMLAAGLPHVKPGYRRSMALRPGNPRTETSEPWPLLAWITPCESKKEADGGAGANHWGLCFARGRSH